MFLRTILISFLLPSLIGYSDFKNQLENGTFEEPKVAVTETFFAPSNEITGWDLLDGSVDLIPADTWEYTPQIIDLHGDSPGVIEQTTETVPGGRYRVRLRYVNHPGATQTVSGRLEVFSPTTEYVNELVEYGGWTGEAPEFGFFSTEFIADSHQLTVRLSSETADNGFGLLIRSVFLRRVLIGDMNCDEAVNLLDVCDFVTCVTNCAYNETADINQDGSVDLLDVPAFVDLLTGQN